MARYIFGMFLFKKLNILDEAEEHLSLAIEYSIGMSWKAKILGDDQDTIFHECSTLLNQITTERSSRALWEDDDPSRAIALARKALKRSEVSDNVSSRLAASFQLARCYRAANNLDEAIKILKNYVTECNNEKEFDNLCIGHRELAECYIEKGDAKESFSSLIRYRSVANNHDRKAHQAEASLYIGRFHWGQKQLGDALSYMREAFMLFNQLQMMEEVEITRALFGMIKGQEVLPKYVSLVKKSQCELGSLHILLRWKERQMPFWLPGMNFKPKPQVSIQLTSALKGVLTSKLKPSSPAKSDPNSQPTSKGVGIRFASKIHAKI